MKTLKTTLASIILTLAVGISVYGGDVHTPAGPTPPPPPATCSTCENDGSTTPPSQTTLNGSAEGSYAAPGDIAVDLLLALLSLF